MTLLQMTTPLGLLGVAAKGTLLLVIGWCGALLLRRAPAVARHLVWLTVIVGVLLIPVLARLAPMNVPVLPSAAAMETSAPRGAVGAGAGASSAVPVLGSPSAQTESAAADRAGWTPSYGSFVVALWLAITLGLLVRLATGMLSVGRIIRRGRPVHSPEWTHALADATARLKLVAVPRLVMSDQVEMAFAFDAFAPTIIIPASAEEWSGDRRRAVLLHELAHIRRRDLIGHTVASVACAVYWFNPFVWAAARRLRVESELASDDVVLQSGVRPSDYAQHLLDMVTSFGQRTPTVALAMARPKEFEGRLVAILDRTNRRTALGRTKGVAMVGLLGLLTVSIAAVVPVPRSKSVTPSVAEVAPAKPLVSTTRDSSTATLLPTASSAAPIATAETESAPMLSGVAVATLLRYGTSAVINPMMMILRSADSLGLDGRQADSIATLNRAYMVRLNTIWAPVSSYYVSHSGSETPTPANESFRRAPRASMDFLIRLVSDINGVLTPEQRRKLDPRISEYLDPGILAAIGAGQANVPAGVFLADGGQVGGGRRGGGGRVR